MKKFLAIIAAMSVMTFGCSKDPKLSIESADFKEGQILKIDQVYNGFGCAGENKAPQITIKNVPAGTKSLAITVYDPDAPTGSGWWHYIAYNIPSDTKEIAAADSMIAEGVTFGKNDFGTRAFGGACPPVGHGKHRYILTVHALSIEKLGIDQDSSAALIGYNINENTLAKASITAYYERKK